MAARGPLLLCLDFDGTIADLASRPAMARPVAGAVESLAALAALRERVAIAIVSGRPVAELRRITGLGRRVMYAGVHGLEIAARADDGRGAQGGPDGDVEVVEDAARCAPELARARAWLARNVARDAGFEVEDKRYALALHYRNAAPAAAAALGGRFEDFIRAAAPGLRAAHNKMVVEALPLAASKGAAVRALGRAVGEAFLPVYFGDDRTDEDAFAEVAARGLGVLVGEPRPSLARFRLETPTAVALALAELLRALK